MSSNWSFFHLPTNAPYQKGISFTWLSVHSSLQWWIVQDIVVKPDEAQDLLPCLLLEIKWTCKHREGYVCKHNSGMQERPLELSILSWNHLEFVTSTAVSKAIQTSNILRLSAAWQSALLVMEALLGTACVDSWHPTVGERTLSFSNRSWWLMAMCQILSAMVRSLLSVKRYELAPFPYGVYLSSKKTRKIAFPF